MTDSNGEHEVSWSLLHSWRVVDEQESIEHSFGDGHEESDQAVGDGVLASDDGGDR